MIPAVGPSTAGAVSQPAAPHHRPQGDSQSKQHVLGGTTVEALGRYIVERDVRKILVLIGAGASVAAGIPDFRSPGTGLYANLAKYDLDEPSDAFSLSMLRESPEIFYTIANDMNLWPGAYAPTAVHHFVKLLSDAGRLLRCCTQNIDGLERAAGIPAELLVEAHGSFRTASCIDCHLPFDIQRNRQEAARGMISRCEECGGIVKPDVVFFGEQLPEGFFRVLSEDTTVAELVIIIGTSLQVRPFALLPLHVPPKVPRVLVNMERVGGRMFTFPDDDSFLEQLLAGQNSTSPSTTSSSPHEGSDEDGEASLADRPHVESHQLDNEEVSLAEGSASKGDVTSPEREGSLERTVEAVLANANHSQGEGDGLGTSTSSGSSSSSEGFLEYEEFTIHYRQTSVFRDLFLKGDCQRTVKSIARAMGLGEKLDAALR